jgi:hypothetical protein
MTIITLSGKAESGKDTTASTLKYKLEDMGHSVLICHYADLLKYICRTFFDWNGKKDPEGRTLLQKVGTEGVRRVKPDYWVDFIKDILEFFSDEWDYVIIPDTRFPNEIESLRMDGFNVTAVHITRPNFENHLTEEQRQHPSETALDDYKFDYEFINTGNLAGMTVEVNNLANYIIQKGRD